MDSIRVSEAPDTGSIPVEATKLFGEKTLIAENNLLKIKSITERLNFRSKNYQFKSNF